MRGRTTTQQVIGISTDTEESHLAWVRTPRKRGGLGHMQIPLVADVTKTISADYGQPASLFRMTPADSKRLMALGPHTSAYSRRAP